MLVLGVLGLQATGSGRPPQEDDSSTPPPQWVDSCSQKPPNNVSVKENLKDFSRGIWFLEEVREGNGTDVHSELKCASMQSKGPLEIQL